MTIKHIVEFDNEDIEDVTKAMVKKFDKMSMADPSIDICRILAIVALKTIVKKF